MTLTSQLGSLDDDYKFVINLDNVKNISVLLKSIHFNDLSTFVVTKKGIKVTVEESKCIEAHAFIQSEIFQYFVLREDQVAFRINLKDLLACFDIFGSTSTALKMCYQEYDSRLKLLLEEEGAVTDCSLKTMEPVELTDILVDPATANKVILQADFLRDILTGLVANTDLVEVRLASTAPQFRISTAGDFILTQIDVPSDVDAIELFRCPNDYAVNYRTTQIKPLVKMLSSARKVALSIDQAGLLSCQITVPVSPHTCHIEFTCVPAVDPDFEL